MADIANEELTRLRASPYILYVEGESDERLLRAWAAPCDAVQTLDRFYFRTMAGGSKRNMKKLADEHFEALTQVIPVVKRMMLFDFDAEEGVFHPEPGNPSVAEWRRKNIENYLLVPDAWKRAVLKSRGRNAPELFDQPLLTIVETFFSDQNLTLPPGRTWRDVSANIFSVVDGKRILFENDDSLFHKLRTASPATPLIRESVALTMSASEIHEDVHTFMAKLKALVTS